PPHYLLSFPTRRSSDLEVRFDVGFGGAFYAYCKAEDLGVRIVPEEFRKLIEIGMAVKHAVVASLEIRHPFEEDLGFLYGTIIDRSEEHTSELQSPDHLV